MNTTTLAPCKRPTVKLQTTGDGRTYAVCHTGDCAWSYGPGIKTDVTERATWHRNEHRAAVPQVEALTIDARPADHCQACGWTTPVGFTTVADRARLVEDHLVKTHGLVTA